MNAQEFYQEYRKRTLNLGYSPIGRKRFTGIIRTIVEIPEIIEYIGHKQAHLFYMEAGFNKRYCLECEQKLPDENKGYLCYGCKIQI